MAAIKNDTVPANFRTADYRGLTVTLDTFTQFMFATPVAPSPYCHFHDSPKGKTKQKLTYLFITEVSS